MQHHHDSDVVHKDPKQLISECPVCKATYDAERMVSVFSQEVTDILHCTCSRCESALLATIHKSAIGMSILGVVTDLHAREARRLLSAEALTEDELFSFHSLISKQTSTFVQECCK